MSDKQRDYWSECDQVYFLDGWGWGLTEKCQRICLGTEQEILQFFRDGIIPPDKTPLQQEALSFIKEYRDEQGKADSGSRPIRVAKHRKENTRHSQIREKTTLR